MKRPILVAAALGLASQLALAEPGGAPPRRGPPVEEIASRLGLNDYQKVELKRIFDEAHERMDAARKASMEQADVELASVLTAEQLAEFKQMRQERHGKRRGPPAGTQPSDN